MAQPQQSQPQPNITFVSMLVRNPEDPNPLLKRVDWLLTLLKAELPLVLYVCPFFNEFIGSAGASYPGLTVVPVDLSATEIFTHIRQASRTSPIKLPAFRNTGKDTEFFCSLMNTKTELVARATRDGLVRTPFVAFLDASIAKVLRQPTQTLGSLRVLSLSPDAVKKPLFPGCKAPGPHGKESYLNWICWVYCGGFFVMPRAAAMEWHMKCRDTILEFLREWGGPYLTWEVNVWAYMMERDPSLADWFYADHNDSMLLIPRELVVENATSHT